MSIYWERYREELDSLGLTDISDEEARTHERFAQRILDAEAARAAEIAASATRRRSLDLGQLEAMYLAFDDLDDAQKALQPIDKGFLGPTLAYRLNIMSQTLPDNIPVHFLNPDYTPKQGEPNVDLLISWRQGLVSLYHEDPSGSIRRMVAGVFRLGYCLD